MAKATKEKVSLRDRIIKNSTITYTSSLETSKLFSTKDLIPTMVPMINVALSGSVDGGLAPGITMVAGPSKHFKTGFTLLMVGAFLNKYKDATVLFYDSEFGTPQDYFRAYNIDLSKIVHTPITNIEELKFDIMQQLAELTRDDKVLIMIDSIGNLASKKEVDDAVDGKSVADMSRAKQLKSLFRMVTPHLALKDIPMPVVNHTYKEMSLFPRDIVSGGTGAYYSADNIWILGRRQQKQGTEVTGYEFIINVEKSRLVKEKSKIPISISFDGGINRWSGLLEVAILLGFVLVPEKGKYMVLGSDEIMSKKKIVNNSEVWTHLLTNTEFKDAIEKMYKLSSADLLVNDSEPDVDVFVNSDAQHEFIDTGVAVSWND